MPSTTTPSTTGLTSAGVRDRQARISSKKVIARR